MRQLDGAELATSRPDFVDRRLDEILFRYRARNFPASLNPDEQRLWHAHCHARLLDGEHGARSIATLQEQIESLAENADDRSEQILGELYDYAEGLVDTLTD